MVDDTFDIVLGLQIPENVTPGLATVYINTYTDWADEGGVPILEEQVSFIEISPSSVSDLTLSTNPSINKFNRGISTMIFLKLSIQEYLDTSKVSNNVEWFFLYYHGLEIIN